MHDCYCTMRIASSYIFRSSKVTEHVTSRVSGGEFRVQYKKLNPNPNPNVPLPSNVFHNKIFALIIIFMALSFLRLIHGLFLDYMFPVYFRVSINAIR